MNDITNKYWKQWIKDYLSCGIEEAVSLTEEQTQRVINGLLNDDEMWAAIESATSHYIVKEINND